MVQRLPTLHCMFVGYGLVHGAVHFIKQNNGADLKLQGPPKIMFFTCLGIENAYCSSTVARVKTRRHVDTDEKGQHLHEKHDQPSIGKARKSGKPAAICGPVEICWGRHF